MVCLDLRKYAQNYGLHQSCAQLSFNNLYYGTRIIGVYLHDLPFIIGFWSKFHTSPDLGFGIYGIGRTIKSGRYVTDT